MVTRDETLMVVGPLLLLCGREVRWVWFLRMFLDSISTTYDLGAAEVITRPGSVLFWMRTHTDSFSDSSERSLTRWRQS